MRYSSVKLTRNPSGAVNKDKNHATKGPSNTQNSNAATSLPSILNITLNFIPNNSKNSNIQEQKSSNKLGYNSSVKWPLSKLMWVDQWSRRWIFIILSTEPTMRSSFNILRHISKSNNLNSQNLSVRKTKENLLMEKQGNGNMYL